MAKAPDHPAKLTEEQVRRVLEDRLRNSRPEDYLDIVEREAEVVETVTKKSALAKELTRVRLFFTLIKDYCDGSYPLSGEAVLAVGMGLTYIVLPFDAFPDFAPGGVGLVDDLIILGIVWLMVRVEVESYLEWKITKDPTYRTVRQELYGR
jgi:uncharacterized membrane protein YkvA (DUF1232 family)